MLEKAKAAAPANLSFVTGNVLNLPAKIHGQYDRVYSYNLVTHLLRIDRDLGHQALKGMVQLLDSNGQLTVGPTNAKMASDERWGVTTLSSGASEEDIEKAQVLLTSPRHVRVYYNASDASGVGIYPAHRFDPDVRGGVVFSDDGGQTAHPLLSPRGLLMAIRLAAGAFHP